MSLSPPPSDAHVAASARTTRTSSTSKVIEYAAVRRGEAPERGQHHDVEDRDGGGDQDQRTRCQHAREPGAAHGQQRAAAGEQRDQPAEYAEQDLHPCPIDTAMRRRAAASR